MCPGSGVDCTAMIAFCKVEDHAKECEDCDWPPRKTRDGVHTLPCTIDREDLEDEEHDWSTGLIDHEGKLFFCRVFQKSEIFTVDVVMKGNLEECKEFRIIAAILDAKYDANS